MITNTQMMAMQSGKFDNESTVSVHCVYQKLAGDVNMYTFLRSERRAADHFLMHLASVFGNTPKDDLTRHVIVCHIGVPPLAHLFRQSRKVAKKFPGRQARVAIVYKESKLIDLASTFIDTQINAQSQVKFFHMSDYVKAMAWVQE